MGRYNKILSELHVLSQETDRSIASLIIDFFNCRFVHGASWDNFRVLGMYNMSNEERKKVYTFKRQKRISDYLNKNATEEDLNILMDKNKFNVAFSKFIKRDWYDSTNLNKSRFDDFLCRNEKFLLKPILSSQGKGIELLYTSELDSDAFFKDVSSKKVILESFIKQHPALASVNPSSVNTVRLITARFGDDVHVVCGGGLDVAARTLL